MVFMRQKQRIIITTICIIAFLSVVSFVLLKPSGSIVLQLRGQNGQPIADAYVYAGDYPDGREIFPPPMIGNTDSAGKIEYVPTTFGNQPIAVFTEPFGANSNALYVGEIKITRREVYSHSEITISVTEAPTTG